MLAARLLDNMRLMRLAAVSHKFSGVNQSEQTRRLQKGLPESTYTRAEEHFTQRAENLRRTDALRAEQRQLEREKTLRAAADRESRSIEEARQRGLHIKQFQEPRQWQQRDVWACVDVSTSIDTRRRVKLIQSPGPPRALEKGLTQTKEIQVETIKPDLLQQERPAAFVVGSSNSSRQTVESEVPTAIAQANKGRDCLSSDRESHTSDKVREKFSSDGSTDKGREGHAVTKTPSSSNPPTLLHMGSATTDSTVQTSPGLMSPSTARLNRSRGFPLRDRGNFEMNRIRIIDRRRDRNRILQERYNAEKRKQQKTRLEDATRITKPSTDIAVPSPKASPPPTYTVNLHEY
ncbi:MAG: hypothetical protein CYPHOPRED_004556 [Cyphobasidiales sp. Tagirdzhanova-0007]|nr:MAG: hypothetical protein CYPHOPRED_004556 [Cyphobasidiales sp. Tagirdzhanova-0007]